MIQKAYRPAQAQLSLTISAALGLSLGFPLITQAAPPPLPVINIQMPEPLQTRDSTTIPRLVHQHVPEAVPCIRSTQAQGNASDFNGNSTVFDVDNPECNTVGNSAYQQLGGRVTQDYTAPYVTDYNTQVIQPQAQTWVKENVRVGHDTITTTVSAVAQDGTRLDMNIPVVTPNITIGGNTHASTSPAPDAPTGSLTTNSCYDSETGQFKAECLTDSTVAIMRDKLEFGVQDGYNVYIDQAADGSGVAVADTYRTPTIKIDGVDVPVQGAAAAPVAPDGTPLGGGVGIVTLQSACWDEENGGYKRECLDRSVTEWGQQNLAVGYTVDSTVSAGTSNDGMITVGVQDQYTRPVLYVAGQEAEQVAGGVVNPGMVAVGSNIGPTIIDLGDQFGDIINESNETINKVVADANAAIASVDSKIAGLSLTSQDVMTLEKTCTVNEQTGEPVCHYFSELAYKEFTLNKDGSSAALLQK